MIIIIIIIIIIRIIKTIIIKITHTHLVGQLEACLNVLEKSPQ